MSNIDKRALRKAAEKAGADEWCAFIDTKSKTYSVHTPGDNRCGDVVKWAGFDGQQRAAAKAKFIAAANPTTVLVLLDEIEAKDKLIAEQVEIITNQEKWIKAVEETMITVTDRAEAAEKRIAQLENDNAYIRNRHKELDLLIGKNILVMQAAIIEWQGTGDARKGLAWIYNTLFGPGELPDESEKDAQAYFDRKYAPLDDELMNLHRWFWEQSEAERAAAAAKGE